MDLRIMFFCIWRKFVLSLEKLGDWHTRHLPHHAGRGSSVGKPSLTNPEIGGSSPSFRSLIARGGGRKPVSLISPTAQRVAVIGHNRAIIPPLIRHTSQPASSRLNMVWISFLSGSYVLSFFSDKKFWTCKTYCSRFFTICPEKKT